MPKKVKEVNAKKTQTGAAKVYHARVANKSSHAKSNTTSVTGSHGAAKSAHASNSANTTKSGHSGAGTNHTSHHVVVKRKSTKKPKVSVKIAKLSQSAEEYFKSQHAKKVKRIIFWSIFLAFIAVFFIFAAVVRRFWPNTAIGRVASENIIDMFNIYNFFVNSGDKILRSVSTIIMVLVIMLVVLGLLGLLSRGSRRSKTIFSLFGSFTKYIGVIMAVGLVLGIWGVDTATILAGVGVIGLVIGLGAQSLISDILSGVFIVFENNIQVGDIITFQNVRGEVVDIGIRTTKTRSVVGDINVINNSELRNYVNMSKHRSTAICNIAIGYGENLEKVEKIIKEALPVIANKLISISEGPDYVGVAEFSERGTVLRIVAKCAEENRIQLTRDLNREVKLVFDKHRIKVAVPQIEMKNKA